MLQKNCWDVAHTAVSYFYSAIIKELMEFVCLDGAFLSNKGMAYQYYFWYFQSKADYTTLLSAYVVYCHYYDYYFIQRYNATSP